MSENTQDVPRAQKHRASAIGPIVMAAVLCAVSGYIVLGSLAFPFRVKLAPLTFGGATFVLAVVVLVNEIVKFRREQRVDTKASDTAPPRVDGASGRSDEADRAETSDHGGLAEQSDQRLTRSEAVAFGWLAAILAAFFLLGFLVGMPLFMLALMRVYGRESWRLSIAVTAGVMLVVYVLFVQVLSVPVYPGILPPYLPFG